MSNGTQLDSNPKLNLLRELDDPEYRRGFVEGHAKDTIAFQLRMLRKAMDWEQRDVAEKLGNPKLQPMISRYENPDYGKYSITTLLELAAAFDVALAVRFVPFSELVEWDWSATEKTLSPSPYKKDKKLKQLEQNVVNESSQTDSSLSDYGAGKKLQEVAEVKRQKEARDLGEVAATSNQWSSSQKQGAA